MNNLKNIELKVFIPTLLILVLIIVPCFLIPNEINEIVSLMFAFVTDKCGWMFYLSVIASFIFAFWISFSKYGKVKFGNEDEKPQFSDFSWIAMLFTAGVGTSIVILGFLEPIYYLYDTPFDIEPMSKTAYDFAHMYGQFHWGFSAWAVYSPAIVAIAYMIYNRKASEMRLSSACSELMGEKASKGLIGYIIDIMVVFGIVGSISTSLGIGAPTLAHILRYVFNISPDYELAVNIIVILIWVLIFGASVFMGLEKGIKKLSDANVIAAFVFMLIIWIAGPTLNIIKEEITSLGLLVTNFVKMNTYMDPFGSSDFVNNWTVFYWGWWLAFMPMMGIFIGKISKGRTIRQVVLGQMLWGTFGCCVSFMIFGGYSLYLQQNGIVDLVSIVQNEGQTSAMIAILCTLPCAKGIMMFMCIVCFIYLATTIDSCAYVIAGSTTKLLPSNQDPARWNRMFWAIMFCVLSIGLMIVKGLETVKLIAILTGLPLVFVLFILMLSVKRMLDNDFKEETNETTR